jgi:uncharacterized membrane protein
LFALVSLIVLGVFSILGLFLAVRNSSATRKVAFFILFVSLVSFGLVARTGYLGGQIRHTELNTASSSNPTENIIDAKEDND